MNDLYDEDILVWSEHQPALLRRVGHGQASNETPGLAECS